MVNLNTNIFQEEQKFLGKLLFSTGKLSDAFDYIKSEFERKLIKINSPLIRDEYVKSESANKAEMSE